MALVAIGKPADLGECSRRHRPVKPKRTIPSDSVFPPLQGSPRQLALLDEVPVCELSSPAILQSLIRRVWCWGLFYVEVAVLAAPWVACAIIGFTFRHPFWTALLLAAPVSALVLIYARLLGRLAWRIAED